MPFQAPAIRFTQKGVPMYLVVLPVNQLDLCSIDRWDPQRMDRWRGYQRGLDEKKIKNLAQYLERPDGILPVAGLLNVRDKGRLSFSGRKRSQPTFGTIKIPDYTQLWVVDMQHRLEGIKKAHSMGHLKDFSVPVLITEGLTRVKEAAQFYIINTRSRRMGVDLTRRLLIEHNEIANLTDVEEWELKAVRVCMFLNGDPKSPWYRRIREPESQRMKDHVATEKSFVPSLKWLLTSPKGRRKSAKQMARFLANYWTGIEVNMPAAFRKPRDYLLQKTPGYMALHRLAPIAYRKYPRASSKVFRRLFKPLSGTPFGEKFWSRKNPRGARLYGTGQSAYSNLATNLRKKLNL